MHKGAAPFLASRSITHAAAADPFRIIYLADRVLFTAANQWNRTTPQHYIFKKKKKKLTL